ncbi:F0F1 ATP synthase subunit delta [Celeribacter sp. PS-C1]|uniref:F0F1 ATP synthase subunit delta n=1 Tax=Celeribacter sp. PS-C1 TaxID=2820813 RepID=UPI001CA4718E|nr:F0F1 ATP synthase subunit delta [Celeribacter sp. PS-C1]MBW6417658.1 F0F1 ATP synthase subunit delta [Celeribacter sp. PS-C1]
MTIDWWTLGLQTINALVLIWILARFLFRPVSQIIAKRQAAAQADLDAAQQARSDAETALAEARREAARLIQDRAKVLKHSHDAAEKAMQHQLELARQDAEKVRAAAEEDIAKRRAAADAEMKHQATILAADIAGRLMTRLPDEARIEGFTEGLIQSIADLPDVTRDGIGVNGPIPLRAARKLSAHEAARIKARLSEVLGRDVEISMSTDPDLLAGLEIDADHAILRNHLRADLERIKAELTADD